MDYERAYKDSFEQTLKFKDLYLKDALELETESLLKDFGGPFISDEEYNDKILLFWEKYSKRPKKLWFDVFGSRDKVVEPRIIPIDLYLNEIIPCLNNLQLRFAIADKCFYDVYLSNVKQAETVCKCIAGFYYNANMNMITKSDAIKLCLGHEGKIVIKPSINSSSSRNVYSIDPSSANEKDICDVFEELGAYFIVQHRIEQHKELAKLNPDTVNTIRVNSLLTEDGVYIPCMIIRVGGPNQQIVEQGSGGWGCEIEKDGSLNGKRLINNVKFYKNNDGEDCVKNQMEWLTTPEIARKEVGFKIPSVDKLCEVVKEAHMRLPHFRWIGWDFTIDEGGDPVLIEYNLVPGYHGSQLAGGKPMFGDLTEKILNDCYISKKFERKKLGRLL